MRKFFAAPAAEQDQAASQDAERAALEQISLEQEQVMCDAAAQAHAQVNQDLEETSRVMDVSDALEDLAIVASKIEEPTKAQLDLVENSAQMAVAGTDVASEELIPSLESIADVKAAMKSAISVAKEKAKLIWERIMAFLKRIWEQVGEFFNNLVGTIPALQRRVSELRKEIQTSKDKRASAESFTLQAGSLALSINGKVPTEASDVAFGLAALIEAAEWVYGPYIESAVKRGELVAKQVAGFEWANAPEAVMGMIDALSAHTTPKIPGSFQDSRHRYPGYVILQGRSLPGNIALVSKQAETSMEPLRTLGRLQKSGVTVQRTIDAQSASQVTLPVLSLEVADDLLKSVEELLKVLEGWKRGTTKSRVEQTRKDIVTASNKAAAAANSIAQGADGNVEGPSDEQLACYRGVLNFNASYVEWTSKPTMALMSNALNTARAVVALVRESNRVYKDDATQLKDTPRPGKAAIKKTA